MNIFEHVSMNMNDVDSYVSICSETYFENELKVFNHVVIFFSFQIMYRLCFLVRVLSM